MQKIDRILTGKYTAIPCFVGIMVAVFYLTFNVIGAYLQDLLALGIDALTKVTDHVLTAANVNPAIHGLVIDGIFSGVGSVLSFLPVIVTLFFFLSLMEDSGYIARVAFCYGQTAQKNRSVRQKHCTDADWIWLYRSGCHVHQNTVQVNVTGK